MSAFEFVFSLFGLLLGLSLAEVLGGLSRALQTRRKLRIGWLTPLLGLVVTLDLISFWTLAWIVRDRIPADRAAIMVGVILTGTYYLAATLVFPNEEEEWERLDDHYLRHKGQVLGAVLFINLATYAALWLHMGVPPPRGPLFWGLTLVFVALLGAGMVIGNKRANLAILSGLILLYGIATFL
jgi:hypothetical protein